MVSDISVLRWPYHFKFFKGCLPQILLDLFLNTLIQVLLCVKEVSLFKNIEDAAFVVSLTIRNVTVPMSRDNVQSSLFILCHGRLWHYNFLNHFHFFLTDFWCTSWIVLDSFHGNILYPLYPWKDQKPEAFQGFRGIWK